MLRKGNFIILEGPSKNQWNARASNRPILYAGWLAFAHDHCLREKDQLCFYLIKPLYFVVEVLNSYGNVRESALMATITGKYALAPVLITPRTPRQECRKRKNLEICGPPTQISQDVPGHRMTFETIAERCKVTARRGCYNGYAPGAIKRFSNNTKQWECHEEKDGRQVVTILDSSDEEKDERYRQFSFGSAQMQRYKPSKIQRLIKYPKDKGASVLHKSKPPTQHVDEVNGGKFVRNAMPVEEIVAGKRQTPKSIMIDKPGHESERKNLNFSGDSLTCQAPGSRVQDVMMRKLEEKIYIGALGHSNDAEHKNTLKTTWVACERELVKIDDGMSKYHSIAPML